MFNRCKTGPADSQRRRNNRLKEDGSPLVDVSKEWFSIRGGGSDQQPVLIPLFHAPRSLLTNCCELGAVLN